MAIPIDTFTGLSLRGPQVSSSPLTSPRTGPGGRPMSPISTWGATSCGSSATPLMLWPMIPVALRWLHMDERKALRVDRDWMRNGKPARAPPPFLWGRDSLLKTARRGRSAAVIALMLVAAANVLTACGRRKRSGRPTASQGLVVNRTIPDVQLISSSGAPTSLADYRGKDIVMAPFLSLCQDECPLVTGAFIAFQRDVRAAGLGSKVVFMEITVDPGATPPPASPPIQRNSALTGLWPQVHRQT